MGAREKLNEAYVIGSLFLAAIAGCDSGIVAGVHHHRGDPAGAEPARR